MPVKVGFIVTIFLDIAEVGIVTRPAADTEENG